MSTLEIYSYRAHLFESNGTGLGAMQKLDPHDNSPIPRNCSTYYAYVRRFDTVVGGT